MGNASSTYVLHTICIVSLSIVSSLKRSSRNKRLDWCWCVMVAPPTDHCLQASVFFLVCRIYVEIVPFFLLCVQNMWSAVMLHVGVLSSSISQNRNQLDQILLLFVSALESNIVGKNTVRSQKGLECLHLVD